MIGELTNHLWQSTAFALAVALVTLAFRKNRAEVRYWLWLCASLKFLIPFALLLSLGMRVWDALPASKISAPIAVPSASATMVQITQPFSETFASTPSARHNVSWLLLTIFVVWACGFLCIAVMRFRGWLRIRAAIRASVSLKMPQNIAAKIPVRTSPSLLEPGVVGFLRPVLLLPEGIAKSLTPPQLEAVLAHEQSHVRRRDNLTSAFHMLVEALFWFHPLVWWIGAKLVEERERACDEAVLARGNEPQIYAEGILNVCKSYLESPLRCVSGVTGSDLKKRMRAILSDRVAGDLNFARKGALAVAALVAVAAPILVGLIGAPSIRAQAAAAARPQFEVASVKPNTVNGHMDAVPVRSGDLVQMHNNQLQGIVMYAYRVAYYQLVGFREVPDAWKYYDIDARVAGSPSDDELRLMFQSLLEDRFRLKVHRESREMSVYKLEVGKNGPRLKPAAADSYKTTVDERPVEVKKGRVAIISGETGFRLIGNGVTMAQLVNSLARILNGPVVDGTDLEGTFDFDVLFARDENPSNAEFSPPMLPAALKAELGLTLEKGKAPVEVLVFDHLEKPTPN
jgi:uncharacterized protein (TIGR03435 family)